MINRAEVGSSLLIKLRSMAAGLLSPMKLWPGLRRASSYSTTADVSVTGTRGLPEKLPQHEFRVQSEEVLHSRYLTVYSRKVELPPTLDGKVRVIDYDLVGHPKGEFKFAVSFPFHPYPDRPGGEVTLIREYSQGSNEMSWALPTGSFDRTKHDGLEACARSELSEEARLTGGKWEALLKDGHPGIQEVKWCLNRFVPFLCVNPQEDKEPGARDEAEFMEIHRVGLEALRELMQSGDMQLPSLATCYLALDRLRDLRLV
eukprot:jgi/Botrbrau1/5590/Bobra.97_2s0018.1